MTIFDIVSYQFRRPSFLPLVDGGNSTCYVRTYVERRSYRCQREQYFSARPGEGVGDRARERKKGKERVEVRAGEKWREWESHPGEDGKKGERDGFTAAGKRRSAGTHVESAKRSRSCVKCLDITVLFRPVRSRRPFSPVSAIPSFLLPPADRPTDGHTTLSIVVLSCPFVQIWWPSRHDLTMIQLSTTDWNKAPASWAFSPRRPFI